MNLFSQQIKTNKFKKCEILKKKFFHDISKPKQSEILLKENFYDVEISKFEKSFNISKKMLYTSNITSLMMISTKVIRIQPLITK